MYQLLKVIGAALVCWCIAALFLVVVMSAAYSHEWYDKDCCDDKDCTRVERMEFKPNGDTVVYTKMFKPITLSQQWWGLAAQQNAYNGKPRLRPSKDSDYHICAVQFKYLTDAQPKVSHHVRCLYVPAGG